MRRTFSLDIYAGICYSYDMTIHTKGAGMKSVRLCVVIDWPTNQAVEKVVKATKVRKSEVVRQLLRKALAK